VKIKTSELKDKALDWAVASLVGVKLESYLAALAWMKRKEPDDEELAAHHAYEFSTQWSCGGPIIERELITVTAHFDQHDWTAWTPAPECKSGEAHGRGPTPLIAAMRCFVASEMGDEVDIPEELK
jgi:hypothetical protein